MRFLHFHLLLLLMNWFWGVHGIWDLFFPSPKPSRGAPKRKPTYSKSIPFKPSNRFQGSSNLLPLAELFNLDITTPRSVSTRPQYGPPRSFSDIFTGSNKIESDYVLVRSPVSPSPSTMNPIPLREISSSSSARYPKTTLSSKPKHFQTNPSKVTPPTTSTTVYPKTRTTTIIIKTTISTTPTTTTTTTTTTTRAPSTSSSTFSPKLIISPSSQSTKRVEFSFVTPVSDLGSKAHIPHFTTSTTPSIKRSDSTPKRALSFITNPSTTRTTASFHSTSSRAPLERSFVTPSEIEVISSNYKPPRVEIKSAVINSQGTPLHAKVQFSPTESSTVNSHSHSSTSTTSTTPATTASTTTTTSTQNPSTPSSTRTTTPLDSLSFVTPLLNEIKSYVTKSQKKYNKSFFVTPPSLTSEKSRSKLQNKYRQYTIRSSRVTTPSSSWRDRDHERKGEDISARSLFQNRRRVRKINPDSSTRTSRNNFSTSTTIRSFEDLIVTKKTPNYRSRERKRPKSYYRRFKIRNDSGSTTNSVITTARRNRVNSRYPSPMKNNITNDTNDNIDRVFYEIDPKIKNFIQKPFNILTKPIKNVVDTLILKKKKKKRPKYIEFNHSSTFSPSPMDSIPMSSTTSSKPGVNSIPSYGSSSLNSFEQLIPSHSHLPESVKIPPSPQDELPSYSSSTTTSTTKNPFLRTPKPTRRPTHEHNPSSSTKKPFIQKPIKPFINLGSNHAKQPSFHANRPTQLKPFTNIKENKDNFVYLHYPVTKGPTFYSSEASHTINLKTRKPYVTIHRDPVPSSTTKPTTIPSSTSFISNGHGPYLTPSTTHAPVTPLINVNPSAVTIGTYAEPQINSNHDDHLLDNVVKRPPSSFFDEYGVPEAPIIKDFKPLRQNKDFLRNYKPIQRNRPKETPISLGIDEYGVPEAPLVTHVKPVEEDGSFFTNYKPIQRNRSKEPPISSGVDGYGVPKAPLVTPVETIEQEGSFFTNYKPIQRNKPKESPIDEYGAPEAPLVSQVESIEQDDTFLTNYKPITRNKPNLQRNNEIPRLNHQSTVNPISITPQTIDINPYETDKNKYSFSFGNSDSGGTVQQTVNLLINLLMDEKNQEPNLKESFSMPTSLDSLNISGEMGKYVPPLSVDNSSLKDVYSPPLMNEEKVQSSISTNSVLLQQQNSFENTGESVLVQNNYVPPSAGINTQGPPPNKASNTDGYIAPPRNPATSDSKHLSKTSSANDNYSATENVVQTDSKVLIQTQPSTSYTNPTVVNNSPTPKTKNVAPDQLPNVKNFYKPPPNKKDSPKQGYSQPLPSLNSYDPPIKGNETPLSFNNKGSPSPKSILHPQYSPPININNQESFSNPNKEIQGVSNVNIQSPPNGNYIPPTNSVQSPKNIGNEYRSPDQQNKIPRINSPPLPSPSLDYTSPAKFPNQEPSDPESSKSYRPPSINNDNQQETKVNHVQLPKLPHQSSIPEYQPPNPTKQLENPFNPSSNKKEGYKSSSKNNEGHDKEKPSVGSSPPVDHLKSTHQYQSKKTIPSTTFKSIKPSYDSGTPNEYVHETDPQSKIESHRQNTGRPNDHNYKKNLSPPIQNYNPRSNAKKPSSNTRDPLNNLPFYEDELIPRYSPKASSPKLLDSMYFEYDAESTDPKESSSSRPTTGSNKYNSKHNLMDDDILHGALEEEHRPASTTENRRTTINPKYKGNGGRVHSHGRKNTHSHKNRIQKENGKRTYASHKDQRKGHRRPKQKQHDFSANANEGHNKASQKEQRGRKTFSSYNRNAQYQQKATTQIPKQLPRSRFPTGYPKYSTSDSRVTKSYVRPISNTRSTTSSVVKSLNSSPNYKKPSPPQTTYIKSKIPPIIYPSKTSKIKSSVKSLPPRTHASAIDYDSEDVYFDYYYDDARDLNLNIQKSTPIHIVRRPSPRPPSYSISKRPKPKSVLVVNTPNYSSPSYRAPPPSEYQRMKPSYSTEKPNVHRNKGFSTSSQVIPQLQGLLRPDNWDVKDFQGWEAYFSKGYDPENAPRFPPGQRTTTTARPNDFYGIGIGFNDWINESEVESFGKGFPDHGEFSDIFGRDFASKRMDSSETSLVPRTGLYYSKFEISPQDQELPEPSIQNVSKKDSQTHLLKELLNPLQNAFLQLSLN